MIIVQNPKTYPMTVASILDTDLYKLTMSNAYYQLYPNAECTFEFKDRNDETYDANFMELLNMELSKLCMLRLSEAEYNYLFTIRYLTTNYIEWLKGFRFERDRIKASLDEAGKLHISVTDKCYKATLYEVPILSIVAACRAMYRGYNIDMRIAKELLEAKVNLANENDIRFSDFGTRRRFSLALQEEVVKTLKEKCPITCTGTSNVYLAMKYGMKPIGTYAHEWVMFHAGIGGFKKANFDAINDWIAVYGGDLGTALLDTYTTKSFLHTLTMQQAKLLDGFRQDSGDEYMIGNMVIDRLHELRIDPSTKTLIFSNALTFPKACEIARYFKGRIKACFGIGTNLTSDTGIEGFEPANIVMKMTMCRYSPRDFWENVIKISDDMGKHMGDAFKFEVAKSELHLKELGIAC